MFSTNVLVYNFNFFLKKIKEVRYIFYIYITKHIIKPTMKIHLNFKIKL
jgi:hypothetical protein